MSQFRLSIADFEFDAEATAELLTNDELVIENATFHIQGDNLFVNGEYVADFSDAEWIQDHEPSV